MRGRVAAFEVMLANSVVRRLIREEKIHEIGPSLEMGKLEGMRTLDQALAELVKSGIVSKEEAMKKASSPVKLTKLLQADKDFLTPSAVAEPSLNVAQ